MALFTFVSSFLEKRKGLKEYQELLNRFLSDGVLSDDEKQQLKDMQTQFELTDDDVRKLQQLGASNAFKQIIADERITEDEKKSLEAIVTHFGLDFKDISFDQKAFNKYYTLALIDQGILPTIKEGNHDLNILFKAGEVLHHGQSATLRKLKRVTTRVNYGGFTASIKITKGVRYRAGTIGVGTQTTETLAEEDTGGFYLTNQRVGYIGSRKHFSLPYSKIGSFELRSEGLYIFKDGKEVPYILTMDDYEVPLAIVSHILND